MNITTFNNNYQNLNTYKCPNFQGHSRYLQKTLDSALLKKNLTERDKLALIETIKKVITGTIVDRKFIGKGTHKSVYKITSKYVARVPNAFKLTPENVGNNLVMGSKTFKKLSHYFGEPVISLGDFQILRNAGSHIPAGVPEHKWLSLSDSKIDKYYLKKYLPMFVNVPQAGYDELVKDMAKLNQIKLGPKRYCMFDFLNPNNVVLHNGELRFVDEIETLCDKSYANTTAKLFEIFINKATRNHESPCSEKHVKSYRKIFKKVILAAQKVDIMHADSQDDLVNWKKAMLRCNIRQRVSDVIRELDKIQYEYKDMNKRIVKTKNFLAKIFHLSDVITRHD